MHPQRRTRSTTQNTVAQQDHRNLVEATPIARTQATGRQMRAAARQGRFAVPGTRMATPTLGMSLPSPIATMALSGTSEEQPAAPANLPLQNNVPSPALCGSLNPSFSAGDLENPRASLLTNSGMCQRCVSIINVLQCSTPPTSTDLVNEDAPINTSAAESEKQEINPSVSLDSMEMDTTDNKHTILVSGNQAPVPNVDVSEGMSLYSTVSILTYCSGSNSSVTLEGAIRDTQALYYGYMEQAKLLVRDGSRLQSIDISLPQILIDACSCRDSTIGAPLVNAEHQEADVEPQNPLQPDNVPLHWIILHITFAWNSYAKPDVYTLPFLIPRGQSVQARAVLMALQADSMTERELHRSWRYPEASPQSFGVIVTGQIVNVDKINSLFAREITSLDKIMDSSVDKPLEEVTGFHAVKLTEQHGLGQYIDDEVGGMVWLPGADVYCLILREMPEIVSID